MHTAKPFVPEPSASEAEDAIHKLKRYKYPSVGSDSSSNDSGRRRNLIN
jgi:hypothetical protein